MTDEMGDKGSVETGGGTGGGDASASAAGGEAPNLGFEDGGEVDGGAATPARIDQSASAEAGERIISPLAGSDAPNGDVLDDTTQDIAISEVKEARSPKPEANEGSQDVAVGQDHATDDGGKPEESADRSEKKLAIDADERATDEPWSPLSEDGHLGDAFNEVAQPEPDESDQKGDTREEIADAEALATDLKQRLDDGQGKLAETEAEMQSDADAATRENEPGDAMAELRTEFNEAAAAESRHDKPAEPAFVLPRAANDDVAGTRYDKSQGAPVLGRLDDTGVAKEWQGHVVIDLRANPHANEIWDEAYRRGDLRPDGRPVTEPGWSPELNEDWVGSIIENRAIVYLGSEPAGDNLLGSDRKYPSVFANEVQWLQDSGYKRVGDYMVPPELADGPPPPPLSELPRHGSLKDTFNEATQRGDPTP